MIALGDYRVAVSLDEPFPKAEPCAPEEVSRIVEQLLSGLRAELDGGYAPPGLTARQTLRALLTTRTPEPFLSQAFHLKMDRLLQKELTSVLPTDAKAITGKALPRSIRVWQGDITTLSVDVIVNAANSALLGCFQPFHRCIDNAIHCVAGPRLREDCHRIMMMQGEPEPAGAAKITRAYNLPSSFVLHGRADTRSFQARSVGSRGDRPRRLLPGMPRSGGGD